MVVYLVLLNIDYMINQDLEKNPSLKLEIMKIAGFNNIKLENIIPIETGSRSYCYLIKNTEVGDVFCKIDDEIGSINFPLRLKEQTFKRQKEVLEFQQDFANNAQYMYGPNTSFTIISLKW